MALLQEIRRTRSYDWGALYALDPHQEEEFVVVPSAGQVWATPHGITICVRSAQDVDVPAGHPPDEPVPAAEVELVVRVQDEPLVEAMYDETMELGSGVLSIGDAEQDDEFALRRGRWRFQVNLDPPADATHVLIVVSPQT